MLTLPRRPNRQRIALGSSARLSQLHLGSSQLGLNALQCDASDGVICGRAALQRRLRGQSRKLSLPVMSQTEAASIEITGGLAHLVGGDGDQDARSCFTVGSPLHFLRGPRPGAAAAAAAPTNGDSSPEASAADSSGGKGFPAAASDPEEAGSPTAAGQTEDAGVDQKDEEGADPLSDQGAAGAAGPEPERAASGGAAAAHQEDSEEPARPADPELGRRVFAGNLPFTE